MSKADNERLKVYAGIGLALFVVVKVMGGIEGLLESIGLKDSAATKELDQATGASGSFWNPAFYKAAPPGTTLLTNAAARNLVSIIYNAFGYFNDNEEQAIGAIKSLKTQAQVSFLADVFYSVYQQDLLTFLRGGSYPQDRLSDEDVSILNNYIQSLPKYFV